MARTIDPIEQRRAQIEREISKIQTQLGRKKRTDFKTESGFENWRNSSAEKFEELYQEIAILDFPDGYNEIPLAIVAAELGVSLSNIQFIAAEGLLNLSHTGCFPASSRITRDKLFRALEMGSEDLIRRMQMDIPEIFEEALQALSRGDFALVRSSYERIDRRDSCINPFALAIEIGLQFLEEKVSELQESIRFVLGRQFDDLIPSLAAIRSVFAVLPKGSHLMEAVRERTLAIADGAKVVPFRDTFYPYKGTVFPSQLNETQNLAIYVGDVVLDSIRKYRFIKSLQSRRSYMSASKEEELERIIHNAVYTALEAHRTYRDSPSSKLLVDKYVGIRSKRRKPPELIELLPKSARDIKAA